MLYAEAVLNGATQGTLTPAQAVNKVRERANMADLSQVTLEDVKHERVLELSFEGHRFYDLLRWGKLAKRFRELEQSDPYFKQYTNSTYLGFQENKNEWLPIPVDEVEGNPYITENNPGWN